MQGRGLMRMVLPGRSLVASLPLMVGLAAAAAGQDADDARWTALTQRASEGDSAAVLQALPGLGVVHGECFRCLELAEQLARAGEHDGALEVANWADDYYRCWALHAIVQARALDGELELALDAASRIPDWAARRRALVQQRAERKARERAGQGAPAPPPSGTSESASQRDGVRGQATSTRLDLRTLEQARTPREQLLSSFESSLRALACDESEGATSRAIELARSLARDAQATDPRFSESLFSHFSHLAREGLEDMAARVAAELPADLRRPALLGLALGLAEGGEQDQARARLQALEVEPTR